MRHKFWKYFFAVLCAAEDYLEQNLKKHKQFSDTCNLREGRRLRENFIKTE